jgi:ParB family transcriptional regulator, chromosome partitioning protein
MARKNPFANLVDADRATEPLPSVQYSMKGASRSILSSIDEMAARANKLVEGQTIVDLDTQSIDESFIRDRLASDDQEFEDLVSAIRDRGQDSPILVRPHPSSAGRYMVVYGHRRLRAATLLGRKVRAVVKDMKDRDHVIAQGQENAARADLSFIEKALFAANISKQNFDADADNAVAMTALAIDRATLSKMMSVAALPAIILQAIGPAKGVGRDRWYELKILLERPSSFEAIQRALAEESISNLSSEQRFNFLIARAKSSRGSRSRKIMSKKKWFPEDGLVAGEMTSEGKRFTLALRAKGTDAKAFGEFLSDNLPKLYEAFRQKASTTSNGG